MSCLLADRVVFIAQSFIAQRSVGIFVRSMASDPRYSFLDLTVTLPPGPLPTGWRSSDSLEVACKPIWQQTCSLKDRVSLWCLLFG